MAYPIEGKYHISHGDANASLLPAVMRFNVLGNLGLFKEMAVAMGENVEGLTTREAAYKAVEAVETLTKDIGIPGISEFGVVESDLKEFAEIVIKNTRLLNYNPRKATVESLTQVYYDAL
jgi:alcohol dehydrogenase